MAEYQRLAGEMVDLARRNQWTAVDRLLVKLDATGQPHNPEVLMVYAQSAARRGDMALAKRYLERTLEAGEHEDAREWLTQIEERYSPVLLAADLPANYRLTPAKMPFEPEQSGAVRFAQNAILVDSLFRGLLPRGTYTFHPYGKQQGDGVFEIEVRGGRRSIDLRSHELPTKKDRRQRQKIDRKLAR